MNQWTDLFLAMPMPETWLHGLLFIAFGLHLLFVLLMLGTAALGLLFFMHTWMSGEAGPQVWSKQVIGTHLGLKSLAVVLGVAPLLIIQVRYSYAFFTATGLFSYAWLSVIPLLIAAFLLIDLLGHKLEARSWLAFGAGILGVGALLTVPAIFTGALALMERQFLWPRFAENGFTLGVGFLPHWGLRYLHILGAALAFGAAFHLFFSTEKHPEKAPLLRKWLFGAILVQAVIGIPLLFTVATHLNWNVIGAVSVGIIAASLVLWVLWPASPPRLGAGPRSLLALLPLIFVSMLVTRQFLQDRFLAPGHAQEEARLRERSDALAAYQQQALAAFTLKLKTVYDNGETIYTGACQPCHGQNGHGDGRQPPDHPGRRHRRDPGGSGLYLRHPEKRHAGLGHALFPSLRARKARTAHGHALAALRHVRPAAKGPAPHGFPEFQHLGQYLLGLPRHRRRRQPLRTYTASGPAGPAGLLPHP